MRAHEKAAFWCVVDVGQEGRLWRVRLWTGQGWQRANGRERGKGKWMARSSSRLTGHECTTKSDLEHRLTAATLAQLLGVQGCPALEKSWKYTCRY